MEGGSSPGRPEQPCHLARREPLRIGAGGGPENRFQGQIDDVRVYNRALSAAEVEVLADLTSITEIARKPEEQRSRSQVDKIRDYFLKHAAPANVRDALKASIDARARRDTFYRSLPTVMVMEEMPTPRESHLLVRGMYDRPGEKVTPMLPAVLASSPTAYPPNRLGLARWLVDPSHPLLARVTVNRFWQMYFGIGHREDRGGFRIAGRGAVASGAARLARDGIHAHRLERESAPEDDRDERDLSAGVADLRRICWRRIPRIGCSRAGRTCGCSAEIVRDQALALAGLLVEKIGGPSVKPYQPEGLWNELGTGASYVQDHGDKSLSAQPVHLHEADRSAAEPWRTSTPRAARPMWCKPVVTNTPLQALNLMNDVAFLEAARVFAQRVMKEGGGNPLARMGYAFRLATARAPKQEESAILADAFSQNLEVFRKAPDAALKYVSYGEYPRDPGLDVSELAAYTSVTSLILNLNETVMKQ